MRKFMMDSLMATAWYSGGIKHCPIKPEEILLLITK